MTTTRHTPGPWRIGSLESYDGLTGRPFRCVYRGDDESVNTRLCVRGGEGENGKVFDCDADARLIAAAPDLLEAARRAIVAYGDLPATAVPQSMHLAVDALRAAIVKAEGGVG